jgi:DNA primase
VEEVVLCFDSDEAGQNATVRSLDSLLASGLAVRVAVVPAPHDPDSFIKASGAAAFKQLIEQAEGFFDYYLNRLCALNDVTTDKGLLAVSSAMAEAVHKTGNSVLIDKYAQKTALRLSVAPQAVRAEFKKLSRKQNASADGMEEPEQEVAPTEPPSTHEYWLARIILSQDDLVPWAAEHIDADWLLHPQVRKIFSSRLAAHAEETWISLAAFLEQCDSPAMQAMITEATADQRPLPNPSQQLADVASRLRSQFIERQMATLMQRASQPGIPEEEKMELLRQQQALRLLKRQPLAPPPAA